jgi:RNA polymerase sigma-70 factor (ECF subfamily)
MALLTFRPRRQHRSIASFWAPGRPPDHGSPHNDLVQLAYSTVLKAPALADDPNSVLRPLMAFAAAGDVKAFDQIYRLTARWLLARVRGIVGEFLAEDVLSDVYLQAWRSLGSFDGARGEPMAWLLTIARTRALDRLRAEIRSHGGSLFTATADECADAGHTDGPEQLLSTSQSRRLVLECLARLNASERTVLGLAYFRDCSDTEIASHLGMPLGTVKSLIRRSQIKMRRALISQGTRLATGRLNNADRDHLPVP